MRCASRAASAAAEAWDEGLMKAIVWLLALLLLLAFRGERGGGTAALALEVGDVFLVDLLLLFRRRIGARNVEIAVLHEVVIGVAAARFAAARELGVALGELLGLLLLGRRLLGGRGAILEVDRRAKPPLRVRALRRQHQQAPDRGYRKQRARRGSQR